MAEEKRDGWAKFEIGVKAVAGILLPFILFALGAWYTSEQRNAADARLKQEKAADEDQHNTELVASLIKSLFSSNSGERLYAVSVVQHLKGGPLTEALQEQLQNALVTVAWTDDDPKVSNSAGVAVSNAVKADPKLSQTIQQVAQLNPGSMASKNPQINEALANIAVNGQGGDKKLAADTLKVLSTSPINVTAREPIQSTSDQGTGSLRVINNNPLSLRGYDKEAIRLDIKAKGTAPMVYGSLNGKRVQGDSLSFTLDKSQSNPAVLVLLFSFSGESGGEYTITVRDANSAGGISFHTVRQGSNPSVGLTYTFAIS
jgi:hypothetical protein